MRGISNIIAVIIFINAPKISWSQIHNYEPKVTIGASAKVINYTSLVTIRDVNLNGTNAVAGIIAVSPISNPAAGMMRINATPNSLVRITYLANETLIDENGSEGMVKAKYIISGFATDNQFASMLLDAGEVIVRIGPDGRYFIWLGAELDLNLAKPGSYKSEFIIEIEAN